MSNLMLYSLAITKGMPSMGRGKATAHAGAHAANQFTHTLYVQPLLASEEPYPDVVAWHNQADGFGTTVILDGGSIEDIKAIIAQTGSHEVLAGIVVDGTYPYITDVELLGLIPADVHTAEPIIVNDRQVICHRKQETAGWMFGTKEACKALVGHLRLLKNDLID